MEKKKVDLVKKIAIVLCICVIGIFAYYLLTVNNDEGDPYFVFIEFPVNETINSSIIHLENRDIMNIRGLDVKQTNGKITRIVFRYSQITPEFNTSEFIYKYGSSLDDPTSRKYLEYEGVYYIAEYRIP